MKRTTFKYLLPLFAVASMSFSSFTLAASSTSSTSSSNSSSASTSAINGVGNKMVALALAGVTAVDNAMYQFDQNLLTFLNANTAATTVNATLAQNTENATNNYIKNSFQVIPNQVLSTNMGMINAPKIRQARAKSSSVTNALTMNVPASDTLYSNNPQVIMAQYENGSNYYIGPPKTNDDNYFNVASVLTPTAFTPTELTAANDYMTYVTKSYDNPAEAIHLSALQTKLNGMSAKKQYNTLFNIISGRSGLGTAYQSYQLALRSNMAQKSIPINNFNYIIAERTPSKTPVAGIYNSKGVPITNPSPLQVESYQANNRIDSPTWIESLQNQSSTTLQRETVVLLAQIVHQNYQAHLDSERLLATLSDVALEASTANKMIMGTKAEAVNKAIGDLSNNSSSSYSDSSSSNADKYKAKYEKDKKDDSSSKKK